MEYASFHTHTYYCDGKVSPELYIQKAISLNNISIGFSSHFLPFERETTLTDKKLPNYISEISSLKEKYKDQIEIYTGMEIDYVPGEIGPSSDRFKTLNLDYTLGSIHFIKNEEAENDYIPTYGSREGYARLFEYFHNDNKKTVGTYYENIRKMVIEHKPDIIAHLDVINANNYNNKYFDPESSWYKKEVMETLEIIKKLGLMMELNTGGLARGYYPSIYPAPWILKEAQIMKIPVVLNSDAHRPDNINAFYPEAVEYLKTAGYKTHLILTKNKWTEFPIE